MLGLFIVVTYVEQRLIVLPNTAGKKELYGSNPCCNKKLQFNLVICSYDVLRNDAEFLTKIKWDYCVLDEGHVIRNTKTKVAQAIRSINAQHRF